MTYLGSHIADFEKLDAFGRYLAEKGLRAAMARRRTRKSKAMGSAQFELKAIPKQWPDLTLLNPKV
jgi:hypothetical protein